MIKNLRAVIILLFILIAAPSTRAQENPPTEESIRELLRITEARKMLEVARQNMDLSAQAPLKQMLANQGLSERQEKILSEMIARSLAIINEELSPEVLEPIYIEIYRQTLTQHEVDGLIAFYNTDVGRASVVKMPLIMKQTSEMVMQRMQTVFPKIQEVQQEMIRRLKEEK